MATNLRFSVGVQLGWSTIVWGFQSGKVIDECEYLQARDSNKCPEGDLNPLSHGAMSRLLAQQCRSKWVWAASCYPFARVNAGRCSHGGNRLLIWVRWHRPPLRTESQAGLSALASLHVSVKVLRPHVSGQ